jgi:hypothetical protein
MSPRAYGFAMKTAHGTQQCKSREIGFNANAIRICTKPHPPRAHQPADSHAHDSPTRLGDMVSQLSIVETPPMEGDDISNQPIASPPRPVSCPRLPSANERLGVDYRPPDPDHRIRKLSLHLEERPSATDMLERGILTSGAGCRGCGLLYMGACHLVLARSGVRGWRVCGLLNRVLSARETPRCSRLEILTSGAPGLLCKRGFQSNM